MRETNLEGFALDKYQVQQFIGEGGFADVYRALATDLHVEVAVKVLKRSQAAIPGNVERFADEARQTAQLRHPNIVTIYAFGTCNGWHYIAMQLLEGETLADRIARQRGALAPGEVAHVVRSMAQALDHAHGRGRIHRDVKPQNIFLQHDGSVVLTDFGLVKQLQGTSITVTQTIIGTPEYMSPEQVRGVGIGPKSDIYALGHVAYEALTGNAAFPCSSTNPFPVLMAHVERDLPPLNVPGMRLETVKAVERTLRTATAKDPGARFASAGTFATALEQAVGGSPEVRPKWLWPAVAVGSLGFVVAASVLANALSLPEETVDPLAIAGGPSPSASATTAATVEPTLEPTASPSALPTNAPTDAPTAPPPPPATKVPTPVPPPPTVVVANLAAPVTHGTWPSGEASFGCKQGDDDGFCLYPSRLTFSWHGDPGPSGTFEVVAGRTGVAAPDFRTTTTARCDASIDVTMFCAAFDGVLPNANYEWKVRVVSAADGSERSPFSDTRQQFIGTRFKDRGAVDNHP